MNPTSYFRAFLISLTALLLISCARSYTQEEIEKLFDPVASAYGIRIVYLVGDDFFSSVETTIGPPAGPARHSKVTPMDHRVLARYPQILKNALEKYPTVVLQTHLRAIHFAKEIDQDGFKYGGSYDPYAKVIYLVNDGEQNDEYSEGVFHHEFSSLLLCKHGFFLNPWFESNPKSFRYFYDVYGYELNQIKTQREISVVGNEEDFKQGFMNGYGQTEFENDFNEYSRMIFTHPRPFKEIMARYPRVRGKFLVWLKFYQEIDPIFTEQYFLNEE